MAKKHGTNTNDLLKGSASDDILLGRDGDDTLIGGNGNDTLDGGDGADELVGGNGNDLLLPGKGGADAIDGGRGIDTVSYANFAPSSDIGVSVQLNPGWESTHYDSQGDVFYNVERFIGTDVRDNFLFFRHDAADGYSVDGGGGDDYIRVEGGTMRGGDGIDSLNGDVARIHVDTFCIELNHGADSIGYFQDYQDLLQISRKDFNIGRLLNEDELINRNADSNAVGTKAQFIYRQDNGQLFYDADGTGNTAAVMVADFDDDAPSNLNVHDFQLV